ncbi:hypothetical protein PENSPDRAFT_746960 [Peniophora sp. CONT]|nr:hypothetical protein PENSPDRAFT_746960 [Peniophora sp. CONT]
MWLYVVLATFALLSAYWALQVYAFWKATSLALHPIDANNGTPNHNIEILNEPLHIAQELLILLIFLIGDCIALWRAYVICGRQRWFWIVCLTLAVADMGSIVALIWIEPQYAASILAAMALYSTGASQLLSTSVISRKAWLHWKDMREFSEQTDLRYSIAILFVLSESGIVYVCIYILYLGVSLGQSAGPGGYTMPYDFFVPIAAMYPVIILQLVAARKSLLERTIDHVSTRNIARFIGPISTHRLRSEAEHRRLENTTVLQDGDWEFQEDSPPPRVEVSFGSTVEMGNVVVAARKGSARPGDRLNETHDEHESMLIGPARYSSTSSMASSEDEDSVVTQTMV